MELEAVRKEYAAGVIIAANSVQGTTGKLQHTRFNCVSCGKNLTMETRIRCVECTDQVVDLCLNCACAGKEMGRHSRHHSYQVFQSLHFPVFVKSWGAEEELLLLEGLTLYGFGNWPDVAEHVGTKSEDECYDHYVRLFTNPTRDFPAPLEAASAPVPTGTMSDMSEYAKHRKNNVRKPQTSNPIKPELGGFMPLRNEFEFPYNDQAEVPVAMLKFSESDTPDEKKLKMDVLRGYHSVLDEREKRTEFVVAHNLLSWKKLQKHQRALVYEDDRKLVKRLGPILQVTTKDKWDALVDGMLKETSLRRLIEYYGELRKEGVRTEREVEEFQSRTRKKAKYTGRQITAAGGPPVLYENTNVAVLGARQGTGSSSSRFSFPPQVPFVDPMTVRGMEVLGAVERKFIADLDVQPNLYLIVKEQMLREYCRVGRLSRKDAKLLSPCDPEVASEIYNFLVEERWIGERGE